MELDKVLKRLDTSADTRTMEIDGKPESMVTVRGLILMAYHGWANDHNQENCNNVMYKYCQYICKRGYPGGAAKALHEWRKANTRQAEQWVIRTYGKYVADEIKLAKELVKCLGFSEVRK